MVRDEIPQLGLGTFRQTDRDDCVSSLVDGLDIGYRHIDTAQYYGNEPYVGEGVAESNVDRESIYLTTKVWVDQLSYEDVLDAAETSLENLQTEYIDLLYVHWPIVDYDAEETLAAFDKLQDEGVIGGIGVSNFTKSHLDEGIEIADHDIVANQVEMHPMLPQTQLQPYLAERDIELVAYAPFGSGALFNTAQVYDPLSEIAKKHDASVAQITLAWILDHENVSTIPKASSRDHLEENLEATQVELEPADIETIDNQWVKVRTAAYHHYATADYEF